jgi:hypothetical protein
MVNADPVVMIPDELVLAAVERAIRHYPNDASAVPPWEVYDHLGVPKRSGAARRVRARLAALEAAGSLVGSRRHGVLLWALTSTGRRRLQRAQRAGNVPELPESRSIARGVTHARAPRRRSSVSARACAATWSRGWCCSTPARRRTLMRGSCSGSVCARRVVGWGPLSTVCGSGRSPTTPTPTSTTTRFPGSGPPTASGAAPSGVGATQSSRAATRGSAAKVACSFDGSRSITTMRVSTDGHGAPRTARRGARRLPRRQVVPANPLGGKHPS